MNYNKQIAIIVVTYNAVKWLNITYPNLNDLARNFNVYLVDNKSSDDTLKYIKNNNSFNIIELNKNFGFGKACNIGICKAIKDKNRFFVLLNQDAIINCENLMRLIEVHISNPDYGVISPIHYFNSSNIDKNHLRTLIKGSSQLINDLIVKNTRELYDIGYTNAAIWSISHKCLEQVGGFDPLFSHYGEDCDYAYRVNLKGLKVGIYLGSIAYHLRDQFSIKNSTLSQYYVKYLIQLKKLDKHLLIQFISITKFILSTSIRKCFRCEWKEVLKIMKAYLLIFKNINKISKNREIIKGNYKFSFISMLNER